MASVNKLKEEKLLERIIFDLDKIRNEMCDFCGNDFGEFREKLWTG